MFGATFNLITYVGLPFNFWNRPKESSLEINSSPLYIVSDTETSCKMASTLCKISGLRNSGFFCQKAQNFAHFGPYDLPVVQILQACDPNTYQIMYGETLDFPY